MPSAVLPALECPDSRPFEPGVRAEWPVPDLTGAATFEAMDQRQIEQVPRLRIMLVDPHAQVRAGLARQLRNDRRVASLDAVATVAEATDVIESWKPDVVLVDPGKWGAGGRAALRTLVAARSRSSWFLIALHVATFEEVDIVEALVIGADLHLLKGLRTHNLVSAIAANLSAGAERAAGETPRSPP
jgi:DNA-binding NarL/FixJ family response regulator